MKTINPTYLTRLSLLKVYFTVFFLLNLFFYKTIYSINTDTLNFLVYELSSDKIQKGNRFINCSERYMVFNNLALQYVNHKDPSNAQKLLLKSLDRNPNNSYSNLNLANVYLKMNKNVAAIDLFESLQHKDALDQHYIKLHLAKAHEQAGNYDKALTAYSCFNSFESSYNSSIILRKMGAYSDALQNAKQAITFKRNNKYALYNYATLLYVNNDVDGAIYYLKRSMDFKTNDPSKMLQLGKMYIEIGDYIKASKIFEELKEINDEHYHLESMLGLSRVNLYQKDYEASIINAQLVLAIDSKNALANKVMADNYLNLKQYDKANKYYEIAFNNGLEKDALIGKAVVEHKIGNMPASKLIYDQLIEDGVADFSYDTYMVMALNEHHLGNDKQSEKFIKSAVNIDPLRAEAYGYQAKYDFERMDFNSAFINYKKAIKLADNKNVYMVKLANCYVQLDRFKKAFELFDNAIEQNPSYSKAYTGKAMCLLMLRRYDEAKEVIEQAIASAPNEPFNYMNKSYILALAADETTDSSERHQKLLEAVDVINKAIELDTTKMRKYYDNNMGLIYMQMDDLDTAWKLIIQDTNRVTINNMGIVQEKLGNISSSIQYYEQASSIDPLYMEPKINYNRLNDKKSMYGILNPKNADKQWRTYWVFLRNDLLELNGHQFNKIGFEPQWAETLPATYKYMAFKSKNLKEDKAKNNLNDTPSLYTGDNNGYSCVKLK